jgi:hypothetical protein
VKKSSPPCHVVAEKICDACQQAKSHHLPYLSSSSMSKAPLELIFSDVWGPTQKSVGQNKYYVSLIDDFSKFICLYPIKTKSEVLQRFHEFQQLVERQYQKLSSFFTKVGIAHHVSCPHTHQQNGSTKRKHRHVVEVGLSLLARASMPLKFWDEAFATAAYLINRLPSRVINFDTPLHRLFDTTPDYSFLKVFGCACWSNLIPYNQHKLQFRSRQCAFLRYSSLHKGYKCLDIQTGRVYVSCDIIFNEEVFPFANLHPNTGAQLRSSCSSFIQLCFLMED